MTNYTYLAIESYASKKIRKTCFSKITADKIDTHNIQTFSLEFFKSTRKRLMDSVNGHFHALTVPVTRFQSHSAICAIALSLTLILIHSGQKTFSCVSLFTEWVLSSASRLGKRSNELDIVTMLMKVWNILCKTRNTCIYESVQMLSRFTIAGSIRFGRSTTSVVEKLKDRIVESKIHTSIVKRVHVVRDFSF